MADPRLFAGPAALGLELGADATLDDDGWLVREARAPAGLDGAPGLLQGGTVVGIALAAARLADRFGAPTTGVDARLHAPTPLERDLQVAVRAGEAVAHHLVELRDGERLLMGADVELAGRDPAPPMGDLLELATVDLPTPRPRRVRPTCWVCGPEPDHPQAQRLYPGRHTAASVVSPWVADAELGDEQGRVDEVVVAAMLACPPAWATFDHVEARGDAVAVLGGCRLRFYLDAPVMEPLRVVGRDDGADGRRISGRGALLDEDGAVYATTSATYVAVREPPTA